MDFERLSMNTAWMDGFLKDGNAFEFFLKRSRKSEIWMGKEQ